MNNNKNEWFETWFDSKYYHILYKNRDMNEAHSFIEKLATYLDINNKHTILDLACGKGQHAIQLSKYGADTYGVDLSENSINEAKKSSHEHLHFEVHDMREIYKKEFFTHVFNLFTSFGYFDNDQDNIKMLTSIHEMLLKEGVLLIDFFNSHKVIQQLIPHEKKVIDGIMFTLEKTIVDGKIVKKISFRDQDQSFVFYEQVQLLTKPMIVEMLGLTNYKIIDIFGDYSLSTFDENVSDRLIIIAQKK